MAYSDFTFATLRTKYSIQQDVKKSFPSDIKSSTASERLIADIEEGKTMSISSEKVKSEFLIAPVIKEIYRTHPNLIVFSGISLSVETDKDLTGIPDFIFSAKPRRASLEAPIFCLVESKTQQLKKNSHNAPPKCMPRAYSINNRANRTKIFMVV